MNKKLKTVAAITLSALALLTGCDKQDDAGSIFTSMEIGSVETELSAAIEEVDVQPATIDDLVTTSNVDGNDFWGARSIIEAGGGMYNVHKLDDNVWAFAFSAADYIGDVYCDTLHVLYEADNGVTVEEAWGTDEEVYASFITEPLETKKAEVGSGEISELVVNEKMAYQILTYEDDNGPRSMIAMVYAGAEESFNSVQLQLNLDSSWIESFIEKVSDFIA